MFAQFQQLTPQQYNALRLLHHDHPAPLRTLDLAGRLVTRAPDITRLLDKLDGQGSDRAGSACGQSPRVPISITAAGIDLLIKIREPLQECHAQQLGHLSHKDLKSLIALLQAARAPHDPEDLWK
ncbi:MAG: MarR family winged helix-turn-helix transcriptional regulator [Planctomycetales bacterium]